VKRRRCDAKRRPVTRWEATELMAKKPKSSTEIAVKVINHYGDEVLKVYDLAVV
jgi:hypothetical protein